MLTFYLIRHGTTEKNINQIMMGSKADSPLTEDGLKNANILSEKLKKIKFDHIYSSDVGRALTTAKIIAKNLKIDSKLSKAEELREVNYGIYSDRKIEEVKKECPQYKTKADFIFPGGESFSQVQIRASEFIKKLEEKHQNKIILLVAHAGVIRTIKCFFNKLNLQNNLNIKVSHEYVGKFVIDKGELLSYEESND